MSFPASKLASMSTHQPLEVAMNQAPLFPRLPSRTPRPRPEPQPPETLIELLTRDLEAWRLAKGVIEKASSR